MVTLYVGDRPAVQCREVVPGAAIVHSVDGQRHEWRQGGELLAVWELDARFPPRCGALSERGDRCSLPLGHAPGHVATNAAGAPCVVWG